MSDNAWGSLQVIITLIGCILLIIAFVFYNTIIAGFAALAIILAAIIAVIRTIHGE